jgi:hypothetical protein
VRAVTVGEELVLGLILAGERFYWSDSQTVRTAPASGGAPSTFYEDPHHRSAGSGRPDAHLVVDGKTVYFTSLGWGGNGIQRVVDATTLETLYEPPDGVWTGDDLVRFGDALYVTNSEREIVRVPLAGGSARVVAKGFEYPPSGPDVGGDRMVTQYVTDAGQVVAAIDPIAAKVTPLVTFRPDEFFVLAVAPSGDALYVGLTSTDLILHMPLPR